jgi:hypothetical protein
MYSSDNQRSSHVNEGVIRAISSSNKLTAAFRIYIYIGISKVAGKCAICCFKKELDSFTRIVIKVYTYCRPIFTQIFVVSCWVGERKKTRSIFPNGIKVNENN